MHDAENVIKSAKLALSQMLKQRQREAKEAHKAEAYKELIKQEERVTEARMASSLLRADWWSGRKVSVSTIQSDSDQRFI
jgi:hypothetical protein